MKNGTIPHGPLDKAILTYTDIGWRCLPIKSGQKKPILKDWPTLASSDIDTVRRWFFKDYPGTNIGIATGHESNLVVLDIDPRHGGDESLARLEDMHGELPPTVTSMTGGGGSQRFFSHPCSTSGITERITSRVTLAPGIDIRADGGQCVVHPSIHPSGMRYEWDCDAHPEDLKPQPPPDWLLHLIVNQNENTPEPSERWIKSVINGANLGARNHTLASMAGHLLRRYIDPELAIELLRLWNKHRNTPPLSEFELNRTFESICRMELSRRKRLKS